MADPEQGALGWWQRFMNPQTSQIGPRVVAFPRAAAGGGAAAACSGQRRRIPFLGTPRSTCTRPPPAEHYRGNLTSTTKYTLLSFVPKSLFEQYRRVANIYFTLNAALSLTPFSPVRPMTTFLPLGLVLGIAMFKEALEDYKRHRQDVEVNNRRVQVFDSQEQRFVTRTWADVRVGDVIAVLKDEYFPADLLFLSSESDDGLCYVETMQLDGETNLKIKKAVDETKHLTAASLQRFTATVQCEPPNSRLYHFTGNLEMPGPPGAPLVVPVPPASVLLRGCSLRNTSRINGLVLYAGHDTKIFMNSTQPPSKRSQVERTVDRIILVMFSLLTGMCAVGCVYFALWTAGEMPNHWYLLPEAVPQEYDPSHPGIVALTNFITSFILYSYLIPISLYVSIEMVKVVQAFVFIGRDRDMYHAETDTPAVARTSNLNEELGMVNTVLTDKTGTLTRNVMEFFKASIGGVSYGTGVTEIERSNAARRGVELEGSGDCGGGSGGARTGSTAYREQYFNFYDDRVLGGAWAGQPNPHLAREFFRMLALCHTVIPDGPPDPKLIRYEAESPDEAALVVAAKVFGFFLFRRTNTTLYLRESLPEGVQEVEYEVLNILEFNSTRKRMSVVLRSPENRILLYCKGADTVIYERLAHDHPTNEALREVTLAHMEDYGSAGLRTLCLAFRELDPAAYDLWQERYIDAKTSMEDRQALVDAVSEEIERDLVLLGCTAIEDKLQDGVPQAIKALADADIRLWVLTGDKMETAVNIGYACSLVTDEMTQFHVTGHSPGVEVLEVQGRSEEAMLLAGRHVQSELERVSQAIAEDAAAGVSVRYALVIDGKALLYALSPMLRDLFLQVGLSCATVVCCRVSPLQKAQVTALVKSHGDVTLAIGDGANDVGMIQKAHIGVGISGQEGMQAVMASDFAIAQFRYLTPLLLVHGRLSYKRITRMILFFFYKNLLFGTTIFIYNAYSLFSGQPIYNDFYMTLFNVVFTATAPLVVGWFDRDLDKGYGLRYPLLYREGQRNLYFGVSAIAGWLATAVLHAVIILGAVMVGAHSTEADRPGGHSLALSQDGILMFSIVIVTVHAQLGVVIDHWTWAHHASCWGSIALWFLFLLVYGAFPIQLSTDLYRFFIGAIANSAFFWLTVLVVAVMCVLPIFAARQVRRQLWPAYYQVVQEIAAREARGEPVRGGPRRSGKPVAPAAAAGVAARASRLAARKAMRAAAASGAGAPLTAVMRRRYSGFVPPYEARSRVFDSNELRASAAAAGYTISSTGEIIVPPPTRLSTVSGAMGGTGTFDGSPLAATGPLSPTRPGFGTGALARALSGIGGGSFRLRRTRSGGATVSPLTPGGGDLQPAWPVSPGAGGAPSPGPFGLSLGRLSFGASTGAGLSVPGSTAATMPAGFSTTGGAAEAVPPVAPDDAYAGNPVLAQLEREFSRDPRRHRHAGKLVFMSVSGLPRIRSRSPKPRGSRGGSPATSRTGSLTSARMAASLREGSFTGSFTSPREAGAGDGQQPGASSSSSGCPGGAATVVRPFASEGGATPPRSARAAGVPELQLASTWPGGGALGSGGWGLPQQDSSAAASGGSGGATGATHQAPQRREEEKSGPQQQQQQQQQQQIARQPAPAHPPSHHRPSGAPSRLLRVAGQADPLPQVAGTEPPVQRSPRGGAEASSEQASGGQQPAATHGPEAPALPELHNEDPSMLQLFVAALHHSPKRPSAGSTRQQPGG